MFRGSIFLSTELTDYLQQTFEYLHSNPEISWKEFQTTSFIKKELTKLGFHVQTFEDCTGVIGEIGTGKPVVAVRADMDALWQEVDGEYKAIHSCGHDAHMTIVLGVAKKLKDLSLDGTVRLIFQPAEEKGTGALKMIEKGVIDDVDYLFGVHLRPIQETTFGKASPALFHGANASYIGEIMGDDAHGARPHLNVNAIEVGMHIVSALSHIHLDPRIPYSVKMTRFIAGGDSSNIIPGHASFTLDLRAQTNEAMAELKEKVEHMISTIATTYQTNIIVEEEAGVVAARVHEEAQHIMQQAIENILGAENIEPPITTTGGDDFHFYTVHRPELKATMLGLGCDLKPGLHHPKMVFKTEAILDGVNILTEAVKLTLKQNS